MIMVDKTVTKELDFDGEGGNDTFVIAGGAATSVIVGGAGNDAFSGGAQSGVRYYGGTGNDKFIGGDTGEIIDMGSGDNTIFGAGGDDTIYVGEGNTTIDAGSGYDTVILGSSETPSIISTEAFKLNDHQLYYSGKSITFNDSLELFSIDDKAVTTTLSSDNANGGNWGATSLTVVSSGVIDIQKEVQFPDAHLTLVSAGLSYGEVGAIKGEIQDLTVINSGSGDLLVRETTNDLNIVSDGRVNGGLYAAQGDISVTLATQEALLTLESGVIHAGGGKNISLFADDIDFASGHDKISGTGQLSITATSTDQNYKIGAAGGSKYGVDYSQGKDERFMNLSMRDMDAFADGFSQINIGHDNAQYSVVMYVGDIEDRQMGVELPVYYAKLTDKAQFTAGRINIVGDVQSSDIIGFTGSLSEVWKANFHDQLGAADSGVTASEVVFNLSEQIVVTGWIIGEDKVTINVHGSTGEKVIVGYGTEPNSVTADMGSAIYTTKSNSVVTIDTSASVIIATQLEAKGTSSSVVVKAGKGLTVLEGAVVTVREADSTIDMSAGTYVHINSGGAVTAGARFYYVGTTPMYEKIGNNASISILAKGEMKLSGSITSAGAMNLVGGGSDPANTYSDYFDTINGQTISTLTVSMADIIDKLNSGTVDSAIIAALTTQHYSLGAGATATSVSNYTPFSSLSDTQKMLVAQTLGYQINPVKDTVNLTSPVAYYYNANASSGKQLLTTFTEGGYTGSLSGYTRYEGTVYYNPSTNTVKTGFTEGAAVDYDKTLIWGAVDGATKSATFEGLSSNDKERVATALGYTYDPDAKAYYNYNAAAGKKLVTTFTQGTWSDYNSADVYWGTATAGDMTVVAHALGYDVYSDGAWFRADAAEGKRIITKAAATGTPDYRIEDINWGGTARPADDASFEQLTIAQKQVVLNLLGYSEYQGDIYYNSTTKALASTVTYSVSSVDWGTVAKPADGTAFEKLSPLQQARVLESTKYHLFTGTVYYNGSTAAGKQYVLTFEQGAGKDYTNADVKWSSIDVPLSGAIFGEMTAEEKTAYSTMTAEQKKVLDAKYLSAEQQNAIIKYLGYTTYTQTVYYNASAANVDKRLVTSFTEGLDYYNAANDSNKAGIPVMNWGTSSSAIKTNRWVITDSASNKYVIYALDSDNNGTVDEIQIQKPHELLGQRGFGYLLTGTITSLQDNTSMVISSHDDTIIRGNINLYGNNSDLTIQSDKWVYFEGKASVTNDFSILGGVSLDTGLATETAKETSVYIHSTATLKTWEAGSIITIKGGKDVDIYGRTVAGGDIGSNGIEWTAGGNSKVSITAGQQVLIDTAVAASKEVSIITTATPGTDDDGWGLVLTTAGGITTAGITSDNSGGLINIHTLGGVTLSGMILSGGSVAQTFNVKGELLTEAYSWSSEKSYITIASHDQLWLGGMAKSSTGEMVEIGAVIRASESISLAGGVSSRNVVLNGAEYYDDRSIRMPGGAKVAVSNADGSIYLEALGDAEVYGVLVAGGEVVDYRDSTGFYLGSKVVTFGGASSITVNAALGHQIRIGRDLYAGKLIDLRGGVDPIQAVDTVIDPVTHLAANPWAGQGVVLAGTTHLATWLPNSQINLSATGDLSVLAPAWRQELVADGFTEFADGHISSDATLVISLDKGTGVQDYTIQVKASDTTNNFGIGDLKADIQVVLDDIIGKDGDGYSYLTARLTDGRLMFTSPRATEFSIKSISTNYGLLGFTQLSAGAALSGRMYAIDAAESGSTVNIGKEGSYNGQILVANAVRGAKAINLYSGTKGDGSQNFTLTETGIFETLEGGIILNPGDNGVVRGDLIARGAGANIVITSKDTLELRGNLTAQRNIFITAGTDINAGETSVYTYGTSHFTTLDADGTIKITGLNDVEINSQIGQLANQLRLLQVTSTEGTVTIAKESGYINTGAEFKLTGKNIDIAGVITSTRLTPALFDNEVAIDTKGTVKIHGALTFAGSLLVNAGDDISIYNTELAIGKDQRLTIRTPGDLLLGKAAAATGTTAVTITADKLMDIEAGGVVNVAADALLFTSGTGSRIKIAAGDMSVEGAIRAGAAYSATPGYLWTGANSTVDMTVSRALNVGGTAGSGTIASSGTVLINTGKNSDDTGLSLTATSSITVDAAGGGKFTASAPGMVKIGAGGDVQLYGTIESKDAGSDIVITSDSLVYVDGLVKAYDELTIKGGTDTTGLGILVTPMVFNPSSSANRVSGGTLDTATGGKIHLTALDSIYLSGVIGQLDASDKANVSQLDITSTSKSVTVDGTVDIGDSVTVSAADVNVLAGGRIFARNAASTMFIKATGNVWVYPGAVSPPPFAAQLKANGLLHILASNIWIDGMITNDSGSNGRILLNSATNTTITGTVRSYGDIVINSGVKLDWTTAVLTGVMDKTSLQSTGSVYVITSGLLDAAGNINIKAGGDIIINADATVGGLTTILNPVIKTVSQEVTKVTGYKQVFAGTMKVDIVTWQETLLVEQIGTAKVPVGKKNYSMDVTLEQIGYYNPNAAGGSKFREVLIEGIDYRNDVSETGEAPVVVWSNAGSDALPTRTAEAVVGDYKDAAYKEFTALNDAQKQAVLNATGYMPLFQFSYGASKKNADGSIKEQQLNKVLLEQTINGTPSDNFVTPDWASNPEVIYRIEVAGWKDKYIKMPKGANQDILRVVSQGEAQYLTGDTTADGNNDNSWGSAVAAGVQYISGATVQTSFTLGTDYKNTDTFWATYGAETPSATATWSQLSATQQNAVASKLGYSVQYDNTKGEYIGQYRDIGVSVYTQDQSYFNADDFSKTVTLPIVGTVTIPAITALGAYTSSVDGMAFNVSSNADGFADPSNLKDDGSARWKVTYQKLSGYRQFNVENQLTLTGAVPVTIQADRTTDDTSLLKDPTWAWGNGNQATVGVDSGDAFGNTRARTQDIIAPEEYISVLTNDTQSLKEASSSQRTDVTAATFEVFGNWIDDGGRYYTNASGHGWGDFDWRDFKWKADGTGDEDAAPEHNQQDYYDQVQIMGNYDEEGIDSMRWSIRARDKYPATVKETQDDYTYDWTSEWHDMYDQRIKLGYQLTTQSVDIYDYRPIYGSSTVKVRTVTQQDVNLWDTQAQTGTETISSTVRTTEEAGARSVGNYSMSSLKGSTITIDSNKNSTISALVTSTNTLAVTAANTLTIKGSTGTTTVNGSTVTVEMLSSLTAANTLTLTAGTNLVLADSALVQTTAAGSDITLASKQDMTVGGQTVSTDTITIAAARDIILSGSVTTLNTITVTSGAGTVGAVTLGTVKDGSITGDVEAALTVTASTGDIVLTAGTNGGNMTLTSSGLTAPDSVTMTASAGKIAQTQGVITTTVLTAHAGSGISVNTNVSSVDLATTDAGNISITNARTITLTSVSAADGSVTVDAIGNVVATSVTTLGTTDRNDITINTWKVGDGTANVSLVSVAAVGKGDITINARDSITQASGTLVADALTVSVVGGVSLRTNVSTLSVTTTAAGNVTVNQSGTQQLTVESVTVMDGSFTLTSAGTVDLASVVLSSNSADNDISVTSTGGDILVRYINAGIYLENGASAGTVYNSDASVRYITTVSSAGDIVLSATGKIAESFTDDAVDLVANTVSLTAGTGILGLEIAVNTVTKAETTSGDIWLKDLDGYLEDPASRGLKVLSVKTATGGTSTVTIGAVNDLFVGASSIVRGDTIKLVSDAANIKVAGDVLVYTRGISFVTPHVLDLYEFFTAPELIEYRAGDYFQFNNGTTKVIPVSSIAANTIIIETGDVISINGTLAAKDYLELNSARDVIVKGDIIAKDASVIGKVKIIAKGVWTIDTVVDVKNSGDRSTSTNASGYVYIQTTGIKASNFEIRAAKDIYIGLQSDFTLSGFVGGVTGFDKAENIKIELLNSITGTPVTSTDVVQQTNSSDSINHKLSVTGGIVSAKYNLIVRADDIASDSSSVFIATDLVAEANQGILLNTLVATVDAVSLVMGSIIINEADGLTVNSVVAKDGKVEITSGNTMLVHTVQTIEDNAGNNIVLKSGKDLQIDYVEAGFAKGALKINATVTLDASGTISELNSSSVGEDYAVDVAGYSITLNGTNSGVVVINDPTDHGSGDDLEVAFTATGGASTGVLTGATTMTPGGLPSNVSGDYLLIAPGKLAGNVSMSVGGTLTVVELPTSFDYSTMLSAGQDLVIVSPINGSSVTLSAGAGLTLGGKVTANYLALTAGDDLTLTSQVGTLRVTITGSGDLTVSQTGSLYVDSVVMNGGDITFVADSTITIGNISGTAGDVNITAKSGNISIGNLTSAGAVTLNAPVGSITANLEADTLDLVAYGNISITEKDDVTLNSVVQGNLASSFTLNAAGNVTLNTALSTTGLAAITLNAGSDGTGSLSINQALTTVNGAVTLNAGSAITLSEQADITSTTGAVTVNAGVRSYDTTVTISSTAPAIPTVDTLVTTDATPVITGMANAVGNILTVTVNGTTYRLGTDPQLTYDSPTFAWRLAIPTTLVAGTYAVTASVNNGVTTTNDTSTNELIIYTAASSTPTINTLTTSDTTPTITGTASVESGQLLTVSIKHLSTQVATYEAGDGALSYDPASRIWSLIIPAAQALTVDTTYSITATVGTNNSATDDDALHIIAIPSAVPTVNTLTTTATKPALSGMVTLYSGESLTVTVGGTDYTITEGLTYSAASSSWSLDLSALATTMSVGTWSVTAQVKDAAGNVVATDSSSNELVILPSVAVSAPTVNSLITYSGIPILSGTASALLGQTLTVTVTGTGYSKTYTAGDGYLNFVPTTSLWSLAIPVANTLAAGTYSVTATVGDATDSTSNELVVRTTTSSAPTVNTLNYIALPSLSGMATVASGQTLSLSVTNTATSVVTTYTTANGLVYANGTDAAWRLSSSTLSAGTLYNISAIVVADADGSMVSTTTSTNVQVYSYKAQPTLSGTASLYSGETLKVTVGTTEGTTDYITANGLTYNAATRVWTLPITTDLAPGSYTVTVTTGSSTTTVTGALVISAAATTYPTPTINTLATDDVTPVLTGTATVYAGETLAVQVGNYLYTLGIDSALTYNAALQTWSLAIPADNALAADTYSMTVNVTNTAGTVVSTKTTANALQITAVPTRVNLLTTNSTTPTITGTATVLSGETLKVTLHGTTYTAGDTHLTYDAASRSWSLVPSSALTADATYDVKAEVYNGITLVSADPSANELEVYTALPTTIPTTVNSLATNSTTPTLTGTALVKTGEKLTVTVNNQTYTFGTGTELTYQSDSGIWSLTIPATGALAVGTYSVVATVKDSSDNTISTDATNSELVIYTAANAVLSINTLTTTSVTPLISGTATLAAGEVLKVYLNGSSTPYTSASEVFYNSASGIWELILTSEVKIGNNSIKVDVTDGTGNVQHTVTNATALVECMPVLPTVNIMMTSNSRPTISGTARLGTGESLKVTVHGIEYTVGENLTYSSDSGIWSLTIPATNALQAGSYDVTAAVYNGGTLVSTDTSAGELVIFTSVPAVPTVNTLTTGDTTPTLSGTATVLAGETFTVKVGDATTYTLGVDGSPLSYDAATRIWTLATNVALTAGSSYAVEAGVTGKTCTYANVVTVYTAPAAVVPVVDTLVTTAVKPTITGSATVLKGEKLTVEVNNVTYTIGDGQLAYDAAQQTWSLEIPADLTAGTYSVTATVTNGAGADTASNEVKIIASGAVSGSKASYTQPTVLAVAVNTLVTNDTTPTLSGTATVMYGETFSVTVAGTTYMLGTGTALTYTAASRTWTLTTDALAAGNYDVAVTVGSTTTTVAHALHIYEVATSNAPTVNPLTTSDTKPTLSGTAILYYNQSLSVTVDASTANAATYTTSNGLAYDAATGIWTLTLPTIGIGTHTVTATAGSASSAATNLVITAAVQPTVNTLATRSLTPTISGTAVVMNGETLSVTVTNHTTSAATIYTATEGLTYSSTNGAWSLSIPTANALAAGTSYDVKVEVKNGSTVVSSTTTANAVVAYTVPAVVAPTVNTLTTMVATPIISGTATVYSGQKLTVTVNGVNYTSTNGLTYNAATLSWSLQLQSLAVGSYDVKVMVTDAGNNRISEVTSLKALQRSVATTPALPTVNTLTTIATPTITGTTSLFSGEKLTVTIDGGTSYDSTTSGSKLTWNAATRIWSLDLSGTTALAAGTHTVVAEVRSATSDAVLRTDTTANELTIIAAATATAPTINTITTNDTTPTITGTATVMKGQALTVTVNGVAYTVDAGTLTYSAATRVWSLTTATALAAGAYTVTAQVADGTLVTADSAIVIYTTPPAVAPTGAVATSSPTPSLSGSVSVGGNETLTVTLNGRVYTVGDNHLTYSGGRWTLIPEALAAGTYTATVRVAPTISTLAMTGETVINSGTGLIDIDAGGTITLGKLLTTNSSDLVITSVGGAVLDAGEGSTDVIASQAKLVINAKTGVGSGIYGALETEVASLDISNTTSGAVGIEETDNLTITNLVQGGSGTVTVDTINGYITVNGNGIRATTGSVLLYAGGNASSFTIDGYIRTTGATGSFVAITTDSGNITLSKGIEVLGAGNITLLAPQGSIVNNLEATGWIKTTITQATINSKGAIATYDRIISLTKLSLQNGGEYTITIDGTNFSYTAASVGATLSEVVTALASLIDADARYAASFFGNVITITDGAGTSTITQSSRIFTPEIEWAMLNGRFKIDVATGKISVFGATPYEEGAHLNNSTALRAAEGPYIQTTDGTILLKAKETIGDAVSGFHYSPLALVIDAAYVAASSSDRATVAVISTDSVGVLNIGDAAGSKGGGTGISTLSGMQTIFSPVDASGKDITILANDVQLDNTLRSPGAILTIAPLDTSRPIQLGDITVTPTNTLYLDTSAIEQFQPGFGQIIFGSYLSSGYIHIGDSAVIDDVVTFYDDLVLLNPAQGGEIVIDATLKAKSLTIQGSGHTTLLNDQIDVQNSASITDSLEVSGAREIKAGGLGIQLGSTSIVNTLTGYNGSQVSPDVPDTLTLTTTSGNVLVNSEVGNNGGQPLLSGLTVDSAGLVTFFQAVNVAGDITINAHGVVNFKSTLTITGGGKLTILGATQVIFGGSVTTNGGAILIEGDEIDFLTGSSAVIGSSTITLRPTTLDLAIEVANPSNPGSSAHTLNLVNSDLDALADGFSQVIIGRESGGHAESHSSLVRIGAVQSLSTPTFLDNLSVYGGNITVEDSSVSTYILYVQGSINLDAYNNITLYNKVEARNATNASPYDITLYSAAGYIKQLNQLTGADDISSEALRAGRLTIRAATGVDMPWTQINTLLVDNVDSGNVFVNVVARDTGLGVGGDVSVTRIAQTLAAGAGNITLTTDNGSITVASSGSGVTAAGSGNISIDANDTGTDKTLTVNNVISGTSGTIKLEADGVVTTTALVSNSKADNIEVKSNNAAISQQANVTSAGGLITYNAATAITMTSGTLTQSLQ